MAKLTVNNLKLRGKRVFTRVDYNVPMEESGGTMVINDNTRIRATLPTLQALRDQGARIILAAHLGRPKGERVPSMSLRPVAKQLAELTGQPVTFAEDCVGDAATDATSQLKDGEILLLENVRYHGGVCEHLAHQLPQMFLKGFRPKMTLVVCLRWLQVGGFG